MFPVVPPDEPPPDEEVPPPPHAARVTRDMMARTAITGANCSFFRDDMPIRRPAATSVTVPPNQSVWFPPVCGTGNSLDDAVVLKLTVVVTAALETVACAGFKEQVGGLLAVPVPV